MSEQDLNKIKKDIASTARTTFVGWIVLQILAMLVLGIGFYYKTVHTQEQNCTDIENIKKEMPNFATTKYVDDLEKRIDDRLKSIDQNTTNIYNHLIQGKRAQ